MPQLRLQHGLRILYFASIVFAAIIALPVSAAIAIDVIGVSGRTLTKDGSPWTPRGFTLIGRVAPDGGRAGPFYNRASDSFGPKLLRQARALGADTLRFQVSQPGLDPHSPIYSPHYVKSVASAIALARRDRFSVIVSMQAEAPAGLPGLPDQPSDSTLRAWKTVAPLVREDQGVMLEIFNEPGPHKPNPSNWRIWQSGEQRLVDELRVMGLRNTLIVDGLRAGHFLSAKYLIRDPLGRVAYGVHPYLNFDYKSPADWDAAFGRFARSQPVVVTEWNSMGKWTFICSPDIGRQAQNLLDYVGDRQIGLIAWALDGAGTILRSDGQPSTYDNVVCGKSSRNAAGAMILDHFKRFP